MQCNFYSNIKAYVTDLERILPKFVWTRNRCQIASATLQKKNKGGGITIPDIKLYYKATMWRLTEGEQWVGLGEGGQREKKWRQL